MAEGDTPPSRSNALPSFSPARAAELPENVNARRLGRIILQDSPKIRLGALIEEPDPSSQEVVAAMQMAVEHLNQNASRLFGGTELELRPLLPGRDQYEVAVATLDFLEGSEVAIIGPLFSFSVRIVSTFTAAANVLTISPAASDPALSDASTYPFFLRTMCSDDLQMQVIAKLMKFFNWTEVVAVHVNDEYGLGAIQALDAHLANTPSRIVMRVPVRYEATKSDVQLLLQQVANWTETTVFVVHILSSQVQPFFDAVREAQLLGPGFVWIVTEAIVQQLMQADGTAGNMTLHLEGLIGTQVPTPRGPNLDRFVEEWGRRNLSGMPDLYALRAYDAVQLVGLAIAEGLAGGQLALEELTGGATGNNDPRVARPWDELHPGSGLLAAGLHQNELTKLGVRSAGQKIKNLTLALGARGTLPALSGSVRLDANGDNVDIRFEVVNMVGGDFVTVGSWSRDDALVLSSAYKAEKGGDFPVMAWPGRTSEVPSGWLPSSGRVLRVAVPIDTYSPYVIYDEKAGGNLAFTGQIIETFQSALDVLPYDLTYNFIPYQGSVNELCEAVGNGVYDLAVGDISITEHRSKVVDFTQQFQSAGLVVVTPLATPDSLGWAFLEPFTYDMWAVLLSLFVFMALVIWWLERGTEGELSIHVKPRKAFGRAIWWSYTTLFFAHAAIVRTPLGRIVGGLWLFVVLIVVATYQANLTSTLTVRQFQPTVQGIASIVQSSSIVVGASNTSWYKEALLTLGVPESRIVPLKDDFDDYKQKLATRIDAIVDELPYALLFTGQNCQYSIVGQEFYKGGWGWAFPKGSRLQQAMSTAILQLSKSGTLYKIQQKWMATSSACGERVGATMEVNRLGLQALGPLFIILISVAGISCAIILAVRFANSWWISRQKPPSGANSMGRSSSRASRASSSAEMEKERGEREEIGEEDGGGEERGGGGEEGEERRGKGRGQAKPSSGRLTREGSIGRLWRPKSLWLSRMLDHQDSTAI